MFINNRMDDSILVCLYKGILYYSDIVKNIATCDKVSKFYKHKC